MPIYEYKCPKCGHKFEQIREFSERDGVTCPTCGKLSTRLVSRFITSSTINNKFFREGEGFSSCFYDPEEYEYRVTKNLSKGDTI
jgi:putative FmdB family regulatory protein